MTTSQLNNSSQAPSDWIDKIWYVEQVDTNNFGVLAPDTVTFPNITTTGTTVQILSGGLSQSTSPQTWPWGTLNQSSVAASMSSQSSSVWVTGQTIWGKAFHIEYPYDGNPKRLACFLDEPSPQIPWIPIVLGIAAGTLLGGLVGFIAGSMLLGVGAGLTGAAASSLVAHGIFPAVQGGGSTPTWVANDGPPGGRPGQPRPHLVAGTTA